MASVLLLPICLDALFLTVDSPVVEAMADFSRQPYFNGQVAFNATTPPLSDSFLAAPLQDENLYLRAGVHLHWALPDALARSWDSGQGLRQPAVPNRWLITRTRPGTTPQQWIVESDYLYPEGLTTPPGSITYPVSPNPAHPQPFRYLGRKRSRQAWQKDGEKGEYLPLLTALGYGEPAFAAFYPNCHTVFGLHDPAQTQIESGLQYDLLGWYSSPEADCLHPSQSELLQQAMTAIRRKYGYADNAPLSMAEKCQALSDTFGWAIQPTPQIFPERLVCYATLTFAPAKSDNVGHEPISVTVGNSGSEALSAYLAQTLGSDKEQLEDQLEAVHLFSQLAGRQLDIGFKFKEARHSKQFTALPAGTVWDLQPTSDHKELHTPPPADLVPLLDDLNQKQQALDSLAHETQARQRQLFADWCKYIVCLYPPEDAHTAYPDSALVQDFILRQDLAPLKWAVARASAYRWQWQQSQTTLQKALTGRTFSLKAKAAPRYWQANEPVLLMAGKAIRPTPRHGQDGLLPAAVQADIANIPAQLDQLRQWVSQTAPHPAGFFTWNGQPWNPFLLEWEVELLPLHQDNNLHPDNRHYAEQFITTHYELAKDEVELTLRPNQKSVSRSASVYTGRCLLTPYANAQLQNNLESFLQHKLLPAYFAAQAIPSQQPYLPSHFQQVLAWYEQQPKADPALLNLLKVYAFLQTTDLYFQSQSLGGFNAALLMQKQTLQLPPTDPLGFDDQQFFANLVRVAVQQGNTTAPLPLNDFHPIRHGALRLLNLRLVDTFGQTKPIIENGNLLQVNTANSLTSPNSPHLVHLPPRLSQPARLNFRWLPALPNGNPVCGWLLPNNLDNSLLVYGAAGDILGWVGIVDNGLRWQPAPGRDPVFVDTIADPQLRQLVRYLLGQPAAFLDQFLSALDTALEQIDPENFAHHQGLALLMGRPIALVRATMGLEIKGLPAVNQDWNIFRQDLERPGREHDQFTAVQFPIRLGEHHQLNDGLVGYWLEKQANEDGNDYLQDTFFTWQKQPGVSPLIQDQTNLLLSLNGPPRQITMLMDPRAVVHATSAILPTKAIAIPPAYYDQVLKKMEVFFLSTPILSPAGQINLPLPAEPGYSWSWLSKENGTTWFETSHIGPVSAQATFTNQPQIIEGWLKLKIAEKS